MKTARVTVRFTRGLHARPAASLVCLFQRFQARVSFRLGHHIANEASFLSILLLSATFNTQLEVQASGEDEDAAIRAAEVFFQNDDEEAAQQVQSEISQGNLPANPS
jgi:phosphocarrier protein HPr